MKSKIIVCIGALLCLAAAKVINDELAMPIAKVTLRVIDEDSHPVAGAKVRFGFTGKYDVKEIVYGEGLTNADGIYTGEGPTTSQLGADITRDGYYLSGAAMPKFTDIVDGRWQPWNASTETVLRRILRPIAMCAKRTWVTVPEVDKLCGYDLEVGDWISPYGHGNTADLVMKLKREYKNRETYDESLQISFSNSADGIQEAKLPTQWRGSQFNWPRYAPDSEYQPTLFVRVSRETRNAPTERSANQGKPYYFRVRTFVRDGRIISALYGKMTEGFSLAPLASKTCDVQLNYYLNPTPLDRNMEFDLKRNLLTGLKYDEQPRDP